MVINGDPSFSARWAGDDKDFSAAMQSMMLLLPVAIPILAVSLSVSLRYAGLMVIW